MITNTFTGTIQRGHGTGKKIGFPTLNIPIEDETLSGIYAAIVTLRGIEYHAAAYADTKRKLLEAHILAFNEDIYGQEVTVTLMHKVREDKRFENEVDLKTAIAKDIAAIEEYFAKL
ncbi:MAG: riboflavin kinase [Minisyncoccia bacterium]